MVNETLGVEITELSLGRGLCAVLISGRDDRPAYVPPPRPPPVHHRRDPISGQRREVQSTFELEREEEQPT